MFDRFAGLERATSVWCPASARLAETTGAKVLMLAGSIAAAGHRALPDRILITSTELADLVRRIRSRVALPMLVDGDHGYGSPENAFLTVKELIRAGADAVTIEDTDLPPPTGGKSALVGLEDGKARLRAAVRAANLQGGLVVGRTSAAGITDENDMLRRLTAYGREGCHALMPVGKISMEALRELSKAAKLPIVLSARPDNADLGELAQLEVRVLLSGHEPFKAAMKAALLAFADIHGRTVEDVDVMEAITGPGSAP